MKSILPLLAAASVALMQALWEGSAMAQPSDSPFLYGIHWYHANTANNDVEAMTGGRGVWVVDQALLDSAATIATGNTWETPWVTSPGIDKSQPWAKPSYLSGISAKGHTNIVRLHPFWGVNVPYPTDPYSTVNYAEDCRAAANLMRNVRIWQIGNEANLQGENMRWNADTERYDLPWPASEMSQLPELYAQTYMACRDKLHEIVPETIPAQQLVLMQPNSPGQREPGVRFMSSDDFLHRMIAAVPDKSKIDGFALHGYATPGGSNNGVDGYMNDLRRQLAIIDEAGLGDRPVFITEFNKHMPNAQEAAIAARFLPDAYLAMHQWNNDEPPLWPGQPNHPLRGAAWFVYRGGAGWDDYSLQHWKSNAQSTDITENPWYAFQAASGQNHPGDTGPGPGLTATSEWWNDEFASALLDQDWPLPVWQTIGSAGSVAPSAGEVQLASDTAFQLLGMGIHEIPFGDFSLEATVEFADPAPVASGEANLDIRFRQTAASGPGYSLTLYSSASSIRPGEAWLRKTAFWDTSYKNGTIAGGLLPGDKLVVQLRVNSSQLQVQVLKAPSLTPVLEWTQAPILADDEFATGGFGLYSYNMKDVRLQSVRMGGTAMPFSTSDIDEWSIYD